MSFGKWLTTLVGGQPQAHPMPVRVASQAQLVAQARIAQHFHAQAARQQIDRQLRDVPGQQNMTDVMRNMMSRR